MHAAALPGGAKTRRIAALSPSWASETTSLTPRRPRRVRHFKKPDQKVSASEDRYAARRSRVGRRCRPRRRLLPQPRRCGHPRAASGRWRRANPRQPHRLHQIVDPAGKRELKEEDLRFLEAVQRQCGIPPSGQAAPQSEAARDGVKRAYEAQRTGLGSAASPPFSKKQTGR